MYSEKVHIMNHPLVAHKLTIMRDKNTSVKDFRELVSEIGMLITYEATRDLPLTTKHIETPICGMDAPTLAGRKFVVCLSSVRAWVWWTVCCGWCPPPVWGTSVCTATRRRWSHTPTSARCPRMWPSAMC